ncbi:hypothetical protein OIU76_005637 [Salix suchowensis]|nr:hypothetical protein OIU76_005637 [Salix suchowensis]
MTTFIEIQTNFCCQTIFSHEYTKLDHFLSLFFWEKNRDDPRINLS